MLRNKAEGYQPAEGYQLAEGYWLAFRANKRLLRVITCLVLLGGLLVLCTGCLGLGGGAAVEPVEEAVPEITLSVASADDCFVWEGDVVTGLTDKGRQEKGIVVPMRATEIRDQVFYQNASLKAIGFQNQDIKLGKKLFTECASLVKVQLPGNLEEVPEGIFRWCSSLEEITIPDSVTAIGHEAFYQCVALKKVEHGPLLETIGNHAFQNCDILPSFEFTAGIQSIGYCAFSYCRNFTEVTLQSTKLEEIQQSTFASCQNLKSVVIPEGVEKIGPDAFVDCPNLEEITLPLSVLEIGKTSFGTLKTSNPVNKKFRIKRGSYADTHFSDYAKQDNQKIYY